MGNESNKQRETNLSRESTTTPALPSQKTSDSIIQNYILIRFDQNIDQNTITKLRELVNTVYTFTNTNDGISFVTKIKNKQILIIISGELGQTTVPILHDVERIHTIYIFCQNKTRHEQWAKQWSKVKGVFTDLIPIYEGLKRVIQQCEQNLNRISLIDGTRDFNQDLDKVDQSFVYIQILKEIIVRMNFENKHLIEFINYCRQQFDGNPFEMKNLMKIEKEYHRHTPIWWYTYPCFLSSMIHCALSTTMEIDLIIILGFFLHDLHQQINELHVKQYKEQHVSKTFVVYRGQGLVQTDFDQMNRTKGGLLSFNNILLTNKNRDVSLNVARQTVENSSLLGILFVMTIDPSLPSTPFANLRNISYNSKEDGIIFSFDSIFRIEDIKQIGENNRLWQVNLTLVSKNNPQLSALAQHIQKLTLSDTKGWYRLGELLIQFGYYDKAQQQVYDILLEQTSDELEKAYIYGQLGLIKDKQEEYQQAVLFYEKSITIKSKNLAPTHLDLASLYNNIGLIYEKLGQLVKALASHKKTLDIYQKCLSENDLNLANCYDNIGRVYQKFLEQSKALTNYEKALEIRQKNLPTNHLDLAISHMNIGTVYEKIKENSKALASFENALAIRQENLPSNHPDLVMIYSNIGSIYFKMNDFAQALLYHEKALEIFDNILPANHLTLITCYNDITMAYEKMGEASKALLCYEKLLIMQQNNESQSDANIAMTYNKIGLVYNSMGEYTKALPFHEKALAIRQETLQANHQSLANSYNNVGVVLEVLGEYSKALACHEKALEIRQKTVSEKSPHIAVSYCHIGAVYDLMKEYAKALSYHETALEIYQTRPSSYDIDIAVCYDNIGLVYYSMGEYAKALSYYEQTYEIYQKHLPPDHSFFGNCYRHMGKVYSMLNEPTKALSLHEKSVEIIEKTLPVDLYSMAMSKYNIGLVYDKIGDYTKARSYYESAIELGQRLLSSNHPDVRKWIQSLETIKNKV